MHSASELLQNTAGAGYHLFTDRNYTSYMLATELLKLNVHLTGTVQKNRKGLPTEMSKKLKMKKHEIIAYATKTVMMLAWLDKRPVYMLTTYHDASVEQIQRRVKQGTETIAKPTVVID